MPASAPFDLSVVIPACNEAARLPGTLMQLTAWARQHGQRVNVVVVDHGSHDGTAAVARSSMMPVQVLTVNRAAGVGLAMRRGVLAATGRRVLLCDADGAVRFDAGLLPLWQALDRGYDIAVGSRRLQASCIGVPQPRYRVVMGRVWCALAHCAVPLQVRDTQCGFKLFRRAAAHHLYAAARCDSFALHVEILTQAHARGLRVAEIPVTWCNQGGSKIRLAHDSWAMAHDLLRLAFRRRVTKANFYDTSPGHELR